jgi:hypothetical protein
MSVPIVGGIVIILWLELSEWYFLVITPWLAVVLLLSHIHGSRRVAKVRIAEAYVRALYCASCGHELIGGEISRGGIVTCSECGAGWRAPPGSGTVHVEADSAGA